MSDRQSSTDHDKNLLDELGYELSDVQAQRVPAAMWWFFLSTAVTFLVTWAFLYVLAPDQTREPKTEDLVRDRMPPANAPLLQSGSTALKDMNDVIARDRVMTTQYGWSDRKNGMARIPVEEAKKRVLSTGLPQRPNAGVPRGEWTP